MTGLVGSGAEPAMLSKRPLMVAVNLEPADSPSRSLGGSRADGIASIEVEDNFLLRDMLSVREMPGIYVCKQQRERCSQTSTEGMCGELPVGGGCKARGDYAKGRAMILISE